MCTSLLRCWLAVLPLLARASTAQVLAAAAAPRAKPSQPAPSSTFAIVSEYTSEEDHAGGPSGGAEVVAIAPPPPRPPNAALLAAPDAFLPGSALNDTTRRLRRQASPVDQLANRQLAVMTAAGMLNAFQVLPSNGQVMQRQLRLCGRHRRALPSVPRAGGQRQRGRRRAPGPRRQWHHGSGCVASGAVAARAHDQQRAAAAARRLPPGAHAQGPAGVPGAARAGRAQAGRVQGDQGGAELFYPTRTATRLSPGRRDHACAGEARPGACPT